MSGSSALQLHLYLHSELRSSARFVGSITVIVYVYIIFALTTENTSNLGLQWDIFPCCYRTPFGKPRPHFLLPWAEGLGAAFVTCSAHVWSMCREATAAQHSRGETSSEYWLFLFVNKRSGKLLHFVLEACYVTNQYLCWSLHLFCKNLCLLHYKLL